ncbi:MAG: S8 family serine peptidase [Polyangia bacterium]|jgi:hypothetical protein|nr:S8 family serine peptidase [Polyangia bacterium]
MRTSIPSVLVLLLLGCSQGVGTGLSKKTGGRPQDSRVTGGRPPASSDGLVALMDWQFPTVLSDSLRVSPRQLTMLEDENIAHLRPAFHPALSELNADEKEWGLGKLTQHARRTYLAYVAGRERFPRPFLLNISTHTAAALRLLIAGGVRIFSTSSGSRSRLGALDAVVRESPDVLFVVAAPHIKGNSISVEELNERPSVLAVRGNPNVILVGCLAYYDHHLKDHRAGKKLGSMENPFSITSQPVSQTARQVFMMSCNASDAFAEGFGGTSAAAPHLASLLALLWEDLSARGKPVTAAALLSGLDGLLHRTRARDKQGRVFEVSYFTLDTILANSKRPLITDRIWWGGLSDHPSPLSIGK